jgi:sigma-E factor negative regulatory protein RseA
MSQIQRERMSALIDDGLDPAERAAAVAATLADGELRGAWTRYHLIGDALRGELAGSPAAPVAERVRTRLAAEPTVLAPPPRAIPQRRWLAPAAGVALAASVAGLALVAGPGLLEPQPGLAPATLAQAERPPTVLYLDGAGTNWNLARPETERKLNAYLINHQEYAPATGMKGMLPYAAFASYDLRR